MKLAAGGAAAKKLASQKASKKHPPGGSYSHSEKLKRKFRRDPKLAETKDIVFTEEDVRKSFSEHCPTSDSVQVALVYFGNYLRE